MPYPVRDALGLSAEQHDFIRLARDFAAAEIRPRARAVDDAQTESPLDLWDKAARTGLAAFMIPAEFGGGGVTDMVTQVLVQQELCHGDIGIGNLLTSSGFFADPVLELGTQAQKERWLRPLTTDTPPLTALAVTEPDHGSDAHAASAPAGCATAITTCSAARRRGSPTPPTHSGSSCSPRSTRRSARAA